MVSVSFGCIFDTSNGVTGRNCAIIIGHCNAIHRHEQLKNHIVPGLFYSKAGLACIVLFIYRIDTG